MSSHEHPSEVGMTTLEPELASTWVSRWDAQQELYIADREERFAVIGDVVEHALAGTPGTVLDLGCGPGSLAGRLAARLPGSRVIGVDSDPLLLALGRAYCGDTVRFLDGDLTDGAWLDDVPGVVDAVVSTTALHWLDPAPLYDLYRAVAARLRPGGVFVDGDHLTLGDPVLDDLLTHVHDARARRAGVTEHEDWSTWWAAAGQDPALAGLIRQRSERAIAHHGGNKLAVSRHAELLCRAGFAVAGTVWQCGDDFVLVAVR